MSKAKRRRTVTVWKWLPYHDDRSGLDLHRLEIKTKPKRILRKPKPTQEQP